MIKASGKISIKAAAKDVAGLVFDPTRDAQWLSGVITSKLISGSSLAEGSKILKQAEYFGKRYEAEFDVLEFQENRLLRLRTSTPLEFEIVFKIDDDDGGSEIEMSLVSLGKLPIALPEFIVKRALEESIGRDLKKLKRIVETAA
jgi:hypothetical protein